MADPISKQLLRAYKDPVSYSKFLTGDRAWQTSSVRANIIGTDDSSKSLKAIQNLLNLQIQNQRVPVQFVKNDFKREKIDHKEIEKRINTSNSISKEINRIAEDFRATLFNIGNMREFDSKLNSLLQNDLGELLDIQRELTLAESRDEFKGDSIKRISYIQEKMYKTMERIQHHFIVQQDIKKKEQKQNIVINVGQGLSGKDGKIGQVDTTQPVDTGNSFLESLFQYLGIRRIAKAAGAAAMGKAATDALKKDTSRIGKNSAKFRLFLKKHPWLKTLYKFKGMGKTTAVTSVILGAGIYGITALDEAEYGTFLNSFSRLISGISKSFTEDILGQTGSSMRDFYKNSHYMNGNDMKIGNGGSLLAMSSLAGPLGPLASLFLPKRFADTDLKLNFNRFQEVGQRLLISGAIRTAGFAKDWAKYGIAKTWDASTGYLKNLPAKREIEKLKREISALEESAKKAGSGFKQFHGIDDQSIAKKRNRIDRLYGKINNSIPNRVRPAFAKNTVLRKFAFKIPMIGSVAGGILAVPDVIKYFSVDIDAQIQKSLLILERDKGRFKNKHIYDEICLKIVDNMKKARKAWLYTITESISMSAINIGVGVGTFGVGLLVSAFATTCVDTLFKFFRDLWLGYDFDLIDFENPYTFINQNELKEATSLSFMITGSGINIQDLKKEMRESSAARAAAQSAGVNASIKYLNNQLVTDYTLGFISKEKVESDSFWGSSRTVASLHWGTAILCFSSFMKGRHAAGDNRDKPLDLNGKTVKDYYDEVAKQSSGKTSIFYPKAQHEPCSSVYQTYADTSNKSLNDILGTKANDYISNVVTTLRYLYSVAMLFKNNINIQLKTQLEKYSKGEYDLIGGLMAGGTGSGGVSAAVEYVRVCSAINNSTYWGRSKVDYARGLQYADEYAKTLSSINDLYKDDQKVLSNLIKNYCLIYLLYMDAYGNEPSTDDSIVSVKFGIDYVRTMVEIIRSKKDWDAIWKFYNDNKNELLKNIDNKEVKTKIEEIGMKINLSTVSSFENKVTNGVVVSNETLSNIANDNWDVSQYINIDDKNAASSDNEKSKVLTSARLTQKILDRENVNINKGASIALAQMVLKYFEELKKQNLSPDELKTYYGFDSFPKIETVGDVKSNYQKLLSSLIKFGDGKNKGPIQELCKLQDELINPDRLLEIYKKLRIASKGGAGGAAVQMALDKTKVSFSNYDISGSGSLNIAGLSETNGSNNTSPNSGASTSTEVTGVNTTVSSGSGASSGIQSSMDFNIDDVMNAQIFEGSDGKWHSNNPFVQWVINKESGGKADAKNPSGATGLFQFMPKTWWDQKTGRGIMVGTDFSEATDAQTNFKAFKKLVKENYNILKRSNTPITAFSMYMAHQQGAAGIANINKIISGKLKPGDKAYNDTMRNMMANVPKSMISKMEGLSDAEKAQAFMQYWEKQAGVAPTVYQISKPTQADMEADEVKNSDGIANMLFITGIENDMMFGTNLSI